MQKMILVTRTILFYFIVIVTFLVGSLMTIIASLFSANKIETFQKAAHIWAKVLIFSSGIKVKIHGLENIPKDKKGLVLISNHQSAADILLLLSQLPVLFRFIIKQELFKIPVFGWYLKKSGYLSIDREAGIKAMRTLTRAKQLINEGGNILVFPEGTRTLDGSVGEFKRGSLLLASGTSALVVPIAIKGSFEIILKGSALLHPSKVKMSIGKPIKINKEKLNKEKQEEILNRVRNRIIEMGLN